MSKSGKLRSLVRELRTSYAQDVAAQQFLSFRFKVTDLHQQSMDQNKTCMNFLPSVMNFRNIIHGYHFWVLPVGIHFLTTSSRLSHPRCIPALEASIREVDQAYDSCNEAWARGEADKFRSTELLIFWVYLMFPSSIVLTIPRWNNLYNFGCPSCFHMYDATSNHWCPFGISRHVWLKNMSSLSSGRSIESEIEVCGYGRAAHETSHFHA